MNRNRITAESVESEQIELLWRIALHRKAGVAHCNVNFSLATRRILESRGCESSDLRIDFVDPEIISRAAVRCQRRRPESDQSNPNPVLGMCTISCRERLQARENINVGWIGRRTIVCCSVSCAKQIRSGQFTTQSSGKRAHRQSDAAGFAVVSRRPCRSLGIDELQSVSNVPVLQQIMMFVRIVAPMFIDRQNAIKIPGSINLLGALKLNIQPKSKCKGANSEHEPE